MKTKLVMISIIAGALALAGCQTGGPNQTAGTYLGAAGGGLLGAQFGSGSGRLVGAALGTFLGSQLGSSIGRSMDERDQQLSTQNARYSLENMPDRSPRRWHNPNTNHSGNFTVTNTSERGNLVCRDFVQTVTIDGEQQKINGRACRDVRDPHASWKVVNN